MRRAWSGESIGADASVTVWPRPVQIPHPPIWIAAFGPKALRQAGSLGLPYLASPMESLEVLTRNYARHAEACRAADCALPDDRADHAHGVRQLIHRRASIACARRSRRSWRRCARRRQRDARANAGDGRRVGHRRHPAQVLARIDEYRRVLGMTHLIATRLRIGGIDADELEHSMQTLAELVGAR